jgi:hypothetical protein
MNLNLKAYRKSKNEITIPYTYSVTHKKSGIHYYGSRYSRGCHPDDLFKTYFTSCKIIHDLVKTEGINGFDIKIRKTFKDSNSCIMHENRFLKRVDAKNNTKFINRQNETIITHSGFTLITNGSILIRWPKEKAIPEGFVKGIGFKKESLTKGRKWIHNPVTKESRMIRPDEQLPEGFLPNRPPEYHIEHSRKLKNKELMYINNGIVSKSVNKHQPSPDGWEKGRLLTKTENLGKRSYKYITITDGKTNTHLDITKPIPEGWRRGRTISPENLEKSKAILVRYNKSKLSQN